jgi:NhaP-type Na+/H+ or K+/H+ antiporter
MYAFLGSFLSALITSAVVIIAGAMGYCHQFTFFESAAYGALISASDTVAVLAILKAVNANETLTNLVL